MNDALRMAGFVSHLIDFETTGGKRSILVGNRPF